MPPGRPLSAGDIVLVPFPFTDLSSTTRRPAVIVWADSGQQDFTLVFATSQDISILRPGEFTILPSHPEYSLTGLIVPTKIRSMKLVTLSRSLITRWLGRIGPLLRADLDRALITALGINLAPAREEGRLEERRRLIALHNAGGPTSLLADLGVSSP